jgi:hypothetical protein
MEIVQTRTGTLPWCLGMFGARFAVFVRRSRVFAALVLQLVICRFLRFHRRRHLVVQVVVSLDWYGLV